MKQFSAPQFVRAVAPLLCATALVSIPAFAQDATPQTTPPVVVTPPNTATVTIPPVVPTVSNPDASSQAEPAAAPAPRTATRSTATRSVARTQATRAAPRAAAPPPSTPVPVAAPAAPAPEAAAPPPAPIAAPAAVPPVPAPQAADTSTRSTASTSAVPIWAWVAGGLALLAIVLIGAFALRRRRTEAYAYDEPEYVDEAYVEPVAAAPIVEPTPLPVVAAEPRKEPEYLNRSEPVGDLEPVVAAPEDIEVASASADDVAELTAAAAPVAERPWLEFAMRPVRAGTNVDEALVEIELTVGNSGSVAAEDVRISTFLLSSDADGSEMERLLIDPPADASTDPVTIKPGEGKRIDATLALLKSDMGEDLPSSFRPIVVADARYTLADGSEGRTSASFTVGVTPEEGEGLEPIELARASMHDNVAAELHGEPVRA